MNDAKLLRESEIGTKEDTHHLRKKRPLRLIIFPVQRVAKKIVVKKNDIGEEDVGGLAALESARVAGLL